MVLDAARATALGWANECTLTTFFFALVGAAWLGSYALSFVRMIVDISRPGLPLTRFGAKKGAWAVVTGATAGIGRDFALQLAAAGFNVFLASRTASKLEEISQEITSKFPSIKTQVHSIDFASASSEDYKAFGNALESLEVGVLINNVGKSYDEPMFFQDLPDQDSADIIEININATLKTTKLVLPGMISRRRGLILTVGSFAGLVPSPLLAVYSASKAFVSTWSQALGSELKGTGVEVELLNAYFIVSAGSSGRIESKRPGLDSETFFFAQTSKLSKIRKSSWMIPTPSTYVRSALSHIGVNGGAVGQPHISTPYHGHAPVQWVVDNLMTRSFWLGYNRRLHIDIRKRVLRKREREAAKANKKE
ncbi:BQ5605_C002g01401 [Microbotryum silenes-dioicae]|uniref:BQ5605_C002g01401 protein n=1 Tax=Microbotryum silenes-dioicae TaxID=796604 RepID=A0A2X0M2J2_9BASI|nr:BQ5605_C002g01401 [Microbotryum silenes-dioicae]